MNDFSEIVIKNAEDSLTRLSQAEEHITLWGMFYKSEQFKPVFVMRQILKSCLQYGNYKRAARYTICLNYMLDKFSEVEFSFQKELSDYFLKG